MRLRPAAFAWLIGAIGLAACTAEPPLSRADPAPQTETVRIISNGWHTAIVVERAELVATGLLPEADDFPDAAFLEFGWGDRVYYPAQEKTLGMTLDAALMGTPAVMHMAGLTRPPEEAYRNVEVIPLTLTEAGFERLISAIAGDFERPDGVRAAPVSRGLYRDSYFYNARGSFHLFNTCNTWTARVLRTGGMDMQSSGIVTADEAMERVRSAKDLQRRLAGDG